MQQRWEWWQRLPSRPGVLIVHQAAIGRALANRIWKMDPDGPPLTILVGHTHRQRLDRYGPDTVVDSGSIGAGGPFGIGSETIALAMLDIRADGELDAVDLVSQDPSTSAARARRVMPAHPDCDGTRVVCHDQPELSEVLPDDADPDP